MPTSLTSHASCARRMGGAYVRTLRFWQSSLTVSSKIVLIAVILREYLLVEMIVYAYAFVLLPVAFHLLRKVLKTNGKNNLAVLLGC